ncbi:MAG: Magnesium transport protein CorA [Pedosphaera sp.]|nr:Magnesium transport protein CorA [Pedosphaera sp.]
MIRSFVFTTRGNLERKDLDVAGIPTALADPNLFVWADLEKPTSEETRAILETTFHFHPLSIEDCVTVSPTPKVEEYSPGPDDKFAPYLFLILHAVDYNRQNGVFATSDLDFFLGKNFLVTYHDVPLRTIRAITDRCQNGVKDIARSPEHLTHALLDSLVENYKPALDELGVEISELEQNVLQRPNPATLAKLIGIKKEVRHLRQIIGPQSDVMARLAAGEFKIISPQLVPYFRDVYDGLFHISQLAQTYTDSLTGILQVYLSMSSNQTGEVVKLLTLITVLTTPLMMIGTWYGMNFKDMPELQWPHGYLIASTIMLASSAATYAYFKKKKWF